MEIKFIDCTRLRNDEHFQFVTEVKDLITQIGAPTLKIEAQFYEFNLCYDNEDEALKKIVKSAVTEEMKAADRNRDNTFSGLVTTNKAALKHYTPAVVAAAQRLQVVFDTYGNVSRKPLNEETSAIYNLVQELTENYAADVTKVGLDGWVTKLDAANKAFDALVKARNDENTAKTQLKMKETRIATETVYFDIVKRIHAFMIVEGESNYITFINKLNGYVDKYNNILAQRMGRYAAKKGKEKEKEQEEE